MFRCFRLAATTLALGGATGVVAGDLSAEVETEVRIWSGLPVPGAEGATFGRFTAPVINASGKVAVFATLRGSGIDSLNDRGIWTDAGGTVEKVARTGDDAGDTGFSFRGFTQPVIDNDGRVAYHASVTSVIGIDSLWAWNGSSNELVLPEQNSPLVTQQPGELVAGDFGVDDRPPRLSGAGQFVLSARLTAGVGEPLTSGGLWVGAPGAFRLAVGADTAAPGLPDVRLAGAARALINDAGVVAFRTQLSGTGVDLGNDTSIWTEHAGQFELIVREGDAAPGTDGQYFTDRGNLGFNMALWSLNERGEVAFLASAVDPGSIEPDPSGFPTRRDNDSHGLWVGKADELQLVVRRGDAAPTGNGDVFNAIVSPMLIGEGAVAFPAFLDESEYTSGIFSNAGGTLETVALRNGLAPGADGATFESLFHLVGNDQGQIAFLGQLQGDGVTFSNQGGIWATDADGELILVAREGDEVTVPGPPHPFFGDRRTIADLSLLDGSNGHDGLPSSFNDAGQLVFAASFTDGTQAVIVATIPEPASISCLVLISMGLRLRAR